jgi:hypothetical protein
MNTVIAASAATGAFLAGFFLALLIANMVNGGSRRWTQGDRAAATLIVLVFLALLWIAAAAKIAIAGWSP